MPRDKKFKELIPKIYKCNAENLGLFFSIKALQMVFPTMTIDQGINTFRKLLGITIDDWDDESMRTTYMRMQKDFYRDQKSGFSDECTKEDKRTS